MVENAHLTPRRGGLAVALLFCASVGLVSSPPADAAKVGVAAAVNPDAFSSLSGVPNKQLNIGKSIFYNERIKTTTSGLVQVLLVDGSTFTVGPNSNLVIDKFVYDPNKKTGEVVATFSKGSMRFIGGKLSKNAGGVKVNTPSGSLAIRGGMFQGNTDRKIYSFLYGHSMTLRGRNGKVHTVYQAGYTLDLSQGYGNVRPTTAEDTAIFTKALSGRGTFSASGDGGESGSEGGGQQQAAGNQLNDTISVQNLVSDATTEAINTDVRTQLLEGIEEIKEEETPTPPDTPTEPDTPTQTQTNTPPPEPIQLELRVLTPPSNYTANGGPVNDPEDRGILGGDDNPDVTSDDFVSTFTLEDGRLKATVTDLTAGVPGNPEATVPVGPAEVNLPAEFPALECIEGICAVKDATIAVNEQTKTYSGLAVLRQDFFAYHITDPEADPFRDVGDLSNNSILTDEVPIEALPLEDDSLISPPRTVLTFGGTGYEFGEPSGRTFAFVLTPDVTNKAFAPFASFETAPFAPDSETGDTPQPFVTPLLYKEPTADTPESQGVWLQSTLYIRTRPNDPNTETEFDQESFVNVALGGIDAETGGLVGERRGGSQLTQEAEVGATNIPRGSYTFTGEIASLQGPDGSHFLGTEQPNLVIAFDTTSDSGNIGQDTSYDKQTLLEGSTNHIAVGVGTLPDQPQTFDVTYDGYAAGLIESDIPAQDFNNIVASENPGDFQIGFNKDANTLQADIKVSDVTNSDVVESYQLKLGDPAGASPNNRSAYINDLSYAAIETGSGDVVANFESASATSYLVSGDQLGVTQFFPETFAAVANEDGTTSRPFCTDCDFIKWGAWGTNVEFGNDPDNPNFSDNVHLGWWVAGDMTPTASLDALAAQGAEATYSGNAIGTVANRINRESWSTYTATGKLDMGWNFANRSGDFEISKFDKPNFPGTNGLTFGGQMTTPGNLSSNSFRGPINGNLPANLGTLTGTARGSFVNKGDVAARGVIGNFNVRGNNYRGTGIFAGSGIPGVVPK